MGDISNVSWVPGDQYVYFDQDGLSRGMAYDAFVRLYGDSYWNTGSTEGTAMDVEPEPSLSDYMANNPGLSPQEYMEWMASHSDEWAEKYLDYLTEKGELDAANAYTAEREDTAYQRLVADLSKAGLNPAMMFGSSASPSASGSQGYVKMSEGANSRAIGNYSKLKNLLLQFMLYQLKNAKFVADSAFKGVNSFLDIFKIFS